MQVTECTVFEVKLTQEEKNHISFLIEYLKELQNEIRNHNCNSFKYTTWDGTSYKESRAIEDTIWNLEDILCIESIAKIDNVC